MTLKEAGERGLIDDLLIISIERDDSILTPKGTTRIRPADVISVFSLAGIEPDYIGGESAETSE